MRYVMGILLLAPPVVAGEPAYTWQSRTDDPDRVYLYLDGKQVGGWDYRMKHYRSFDGTSWGTPTDKPPVTPPANRVVVVPRQTSMGIPQPSATLPQLRGPVRRRVGTVMGQAVTDTTMRIIDEIPGAVVDSLKKGNYQLNYQYSVTGPGRQPEAVTASPSPTQPAQTPQRRLIFPRR